jgi:hypothetical protein
MWREADMKRCLHLHLALGAKADLLARFRDFRFSPRADMRGLVGLITIDSKTEKAPLGFG